MKKTFSALLPAIIILCVLAQPFVFVGKAFCQSAQVIILEKEGKEGCRFSVELAVSPADQARGLMFRKTMDDQAGMFFIFDREEIRHFWMRNTLVPLDMIFIDNKFLVVDLHRGAKPLDETVVSSRKPARYVLEVNAGRADRCRIKAGSKVKLVKYP